VKRAHPRLDLFNLLPEHLKAWGKQLSFEEFLVKPDGQMATPDVYDQRGRRVPLRGSRQDSIQFDEDYSPGLQGHEDSDVIPARDLDEDDDDEAGAEEEEDHLDEEEGEGRERRRVRFADEAGVGSDNVPTNPNTLVGQLKNLFRLKN